MRGAHHLGGLVEHHLHQPRVLAELVGQPLRFRRRLDLGKWTDAALGLRDDLLGDHDDVASAHLWGDQRSQIVARLHLGDAGERAYFQAQLSAPAGAFKRAPARSS